MYTRSVDTTATRAGVSCLSFNQVRSTFFILLFDCLRLWLNGTRVGRSTHW
jgi:hypothetical protein